MTSAIVARRMPWPTDARSPPRMPTWVRMKRITAMASAFSPALFQDGGFACRRARASVRPAAFISSAVGLRPVRPRASIEPAALPRCLVRLLRFVWAMAPTRVDDPPEVSGPAAGRRPGSPSNAARGAGATSSAPVTVACRWTAATTSAIVRAVLDVGRDLDAFGLQAEGADVERGAQRLRDLLRGVQRCVDLDVEGDQRRSRGDQRRAGGGMRRRAEVGARRA